MVKLISEVSHELRSPLQAIMGATQVLRARFMSSSESEKLLSLVERNARLEAWLVDDLVDMARIATGKLSVNLQTTYLRPVVEIVIESMRPRLDEKRISIQWKKLGPDSLILGDPERLQQIVSNLLRQRCEIYGPGRLDQSLLRHRELLPR